MTTKQTIDGVPRELIEWLVTPGNVMDLGGRREELRALLDKEVSGDSRAPQPQGDHLGEIVEFGTGLKEVSWRKGKMPALGTKLYAEQPAPVAVAAPDRIKGMVEAVGGEYAVMIDPDNRHFGWTFKRHPDGHWVSGRKATDAEMSAARSHAHITNQL